MEMSVNWMAYAIAVVLQMVIGFLWFHPAVMGKLYAKSRGINFEDLRPSNPGMAYGLMLVFTLLFTFWLMMNVTGPGQEDVKFHTFQHGIFHGVALAIMIFTPLFGTLTVFEGRPWSWFIVHVGHWLVRAAVAGGVLSMMR